MSKSAVVFIAFLLAGAGIPATHAQSNVDLPLKLSAISEKLSADESTYLKRTYTLLQFVDPKYVKRTIEKAPDFHHFQDRVNDWAKHNPDLWENISTRLEYCDSLRRKGFLGTDIYGHEVDVRWELFIKYGPPANVLTLPCRCDEGSVACSIWTYTWQSDTAGSVGNEVSCQSQHGEDYPTRVINSDASSLPVASPIWPIINVSKFSDKRGATDVWFSIWVRGDQFTRSTLEGARLTIVVELYDSNQTSLVARGTCISDLQIIRGILEATERQDHRLIRAMGYIGFAGIESGDYLAHLKISGAPYNEGEEWLDLSIPADMRISDLLLLDRSAGVGENIESGIIRNLRADQYDNPEAVFSRGTRLNLYAEADLPQENAREYEVRVTLLPLPEVSRPAREMVRIGDAVIVSDSLDRPFAEGQWDTPQRRQILEEMANAEPDAKVITLLRKKFDAEDSSVAIEVATELADNLKSGQYLLSVTVSDPQYQEYFLSTRRIIRVAPLTQSPRRSYVRKY